MPPKTADLAKKSTMKKYRLLRGAPCAIYTPPCIGLAGPPKKASFFHSRFFRKISGFRRHLLSSKSSHLIALCNKNQERACLSKFQFLAQTEISNHYILGCWALRRPGPEVRTSENHRPVRIFFETGMACRDGLFDPEPAPRFFENTKKTRQSLDSRPLS